MDEQNRPTDEPSDEATAGDADETFTWTEDAGKPGTGPAHDAKDGAANVLGSLREAVDDIAERAAPTVREISARAAELTATAAVKAAPLVKRAGEVTADASKKLAEKSRAWAADLRTSGGDATSSPETGSTGAPSDLAADQPPVTTDFDAAPPFESAADSASPDDATVERESNPPGV